MNWAYFASGFRESRGNHTGTKANAYQVRKRYDCVVTYTEWDETPEKYAADLVSQWREGDKLLVVGYSWGCGNWIHKFLWKLYRLNPDIKVNYLILVDPVVRTRFFSLRWFAVMDWGCIRFPDTIDCCYKFYQNVDEPNASKLKFDGRLKGYEQFCIPVPHSRIDNSAAVRAKVLRVAAQLFEL